MRWRGLWVLAAVASLAACADTTHCDKLPNYVGEVPIGTWEAFPLRVHVSLEGLQAPELERAIEEAALSGLSRWSEELGEPGSMVRVDDPSDAQVFVTLDARDSNWDRLARVLHRVGDHYYESAQVLLNPEMTADGIEAVRRGRISRADFLAHLEGTFAHEMGHVLGVVGHARTPGFLMSAEPPDSWSHYPPPLPGDLNTLAHVYLCPRSDRYSPRYSRSSGGSRAADARDPWKGPQEIDGQVTGAACARDRFLDVPSRTGDAMNPETP